MNKGYYRCQDILFEISKKVRRAHVLRSHRLLVTSLLLEYVSLQ